MIDKRRPAPNQVEIMNIIGNVAGKNVLIVDDLIDTAGTFCNAISALRKAGAQMVYGATTHPLLSGNAYERVNESDVDKLLVCDTIPLKQESSKIEVMTVAGIFAEAIERTFENKSISSLFDIDKDKI